MKAAWIGAFISTRANHLGAVMKAATPRVSVGARLRDRVGVGVGVRVRVRVRVGVRVR